jgi:DnaJ like chaperone protein
MVAIFDYKYYKWAAIIPGFIIGDFIGAIAAYFLVQEIMINKEQDIDFEIALLRICSMIIKTSGGINRSEVDTVRRFFKNTYGVKRTNKIFNDVKTSPLKHYTLNQLVNVIKEKTIPTKYYSIMQLLFQIAAADGTISKEEEDLIVLVGFEFQFTKDRIDAIKSQFVRVKTRSKKYSQETIQNLSILGLKGGASKSEIKSAYRTLAKEFHPDKLTGMNQSIQDLAKEKFQMIQSAYEYLEKNYA